MKSVFASWSHATNSQALLDKALKSAKITLIEADVSLGRLSNKTEEDVFPIMAHPPDKISDLSLKQFLEKIIDEESNIKVVKLDFKNTLAIRESLKLASQILLSKYNFELWLNADILKGPNGADTIPIDPDVFLDTCLEYFPFAVLSLGYTTVYNTNKHQMKYSQEQMEEMYRLLDKKKCLGKTLTFPVRAVFACNSQKELEWLLQNTTNSTLTIWGQDQLNEHQVQQLKHLMTSLNSKVYLDINSQLQNCILQT